MLTQHTKAVCMLTQWTKAVCTLTQQMKADALHAYSAQLPFLMLSPLPSALCPLWLPLTQLAIFPRRFTACLPVADSASASTSASCSHCHYHCYYNYQNLTLPLSFCYFAVLNSEQLMYFFFYHSFNCFFFPVFFTTLYNCSQYFLVLCASLLLM